MKIFLDKEIDRKVSEELTFKINNCKDSEIELIINCPGGSIFEGYNIYNSLKNFNGKTTAKIQGLAASMAFPIAMACDVVSISEHSIIMLHNPHSEGAKDDKEFEILDKFKSSLLTIINQKTGMDKEKMSKMMNEETWMTANEFSKIFNIKQGREDIIVYLSSEEDGQSVASKLVNIYNKINNINMKNEIKETEEVKDSVENIENEVDEKETEEKVEETTNEVKETTEEVKNEEIEIETSEETPDVELVIEKLETKIKELEAELAKYKEAEEAKKEEEVEEVLNSVKDRLTDSEYSKWKNIGKTDFDFMKSSVSKLKNINIENNLKVEDIINKEEKNENIDLRKLEKENPAKVKDMMNNSPEQYAKLFKATYGVDFEK